MEALPCVEKITFTQGLHGSEGVKPTTVLALRLPSLGKYLEKPQVPVTARKKTELVGKDEQGRYRTAAAKEYPSSLSRAFARAMLDEMDHHAKDSGQVQEENGRRIVEEAEWLETLGGWMVPFDEYCEEGAIMQDYGGFNKAEEGHPKLEQREARRKRRIAQNKKEALQRREVRRRNGLKLCKKVLFIYSAECIEMLSGRGQKDEDGFISENFGSGQLLRCLIVLSFAVTVNSSSEIGLMRHTVKKPRVWAVLTAQENI